MTKIFRKRDAGVLAIIIVIIYISLEKTSYNYKLEPSWFFDQPIGTGSHWLQLPPIVTDINGDGSNEIVFISKNQILQVISADLPENWIEGVYTPKIVASQRLNPVGVLGATPVAIKVGYVDTYNVNTARKQVIAVLRQDWRVSCYDYQLNLLWERSISHMKAHDLDNIMSKYEINEAAIHISSLNIETNRTGGTVFVGIRVRLNDATATNIRVEGMSNMRVSGDAEHPDMKYRTELEHFTVHALDGQSGSIIWLHDGSEEKSEDLRKSLPHHAFRMEAKELSKQIHRTTHGNDWTVFKSSMLVELPHIWTGSLDTNFRLAHFVRKHMGAGAGTQKTLSKVASKSQEKKQTPATKKQSGKVLSGHGRFLGVESPPLSVDAVLPHDASEHTDHPNVIVIHTRFGLEILALKGGDSISSLALPEGRVSGDIDGDGIVDSVLVLQNDDDVANHGSMYAHVGKKIQRCSLMVVSGLPATAQLFNGSLCSNWRSLQEPLSDVVGGTDSNPQSISATRPILLRKHDYESLTESKYKDVCVAINTGVLTCFSGKGDILWQSTKNPHWKVGFAHASLMQFVPDSKTTDSLGSHDHTESLLFISGDSEAALIARDSGSVLSYADLPYPPISKPIFGDFNNDNVNDVIIMSTDSLFGYRVVVSESSRGMLVATLVLMTIAVLIFIANIRTEDILDPKFGKRSVLSVTRSTDDWHID